MFGSAVYNRNHGTWSDYLIEPDRWMYKQWQQIDTDICKSDVTWGDAIMRISSIVLLTIATFATTLLSVLGIALKTLEGYLFSSCKSKTDPLQGLSNEMIPVYDDLSHPTDNAFANLENILNEKIVPRVEKYFAEHGSFPNVTCNVSTKNVDPRYIRLGQGFEGTIKFDMDTTSISQYCSSGYTRSIGIKWNPSVANPYFDISEQAIMKELMVFR